MFGDVEMLICVPFSEVTYIDFKDGLMFFVNRTINARPLLPTNIRYQRYKVYF